MKFPRCSAVVLTAGLLSSSPGFANEWNYSLTPYLWATAIDGTQGVGGQTVELDASFGDLLEILDIGLAAHFEANSQQWGWFGDVFYAELSDKKNRPVGTLGGEIKQTVAELGATYRLNDTLEGLVGLRYQESDTRLRILNVGTRRAEEKWTDGFAGLRWTPIDNGKWQFRLRGDIGAGDSDLVWLGYLGLGYQFNDKVALQAGYRYLDTDYEDGGFTWDIAQSGLGLGISFYW